MILNLVLILLIIFLLIVLSMVWPPDSPWAPWWRTSKKTARQMCKLARVTKNDVVYDLGSGDGTSLITAAKEFAARGVGIEIDPLRSFISQLFIRFSGASSQIKIITGNLFEQNLSDATVVFLYLVPKTLGRLKPKLLKELKPGTRIVTVVYQIPGGLTGKEEKNIAQPIGRPLYLYTVPKVKV